MAVTVTLHAFSADKLRSMCSELDELVDEEYNSETHYEKQMRIEQIKDQIAFTVLSSVKMGDIEEGAQP